jgi:hypothetical protein
MPPSGEFSLTECLHEYDEHEKTSFELSKFLLDARNDREAVPMSGHLKSGLEKKGEMETKRQKVAQRK